MTKSLYGDRDTIGTIAEKARVSEESPVVGDMGHEMIKSFVEDLNNSIQANPFDGRPFYIIVHEKKDAQLKNALMRRMIEQEKRPYPEPNTSVFWTDPKSQTTKFCWSLPHWTAFDNYLFNNEKYNKEQIEDITAYKNENLEHFGFFRVPVKKKGKDQGALSYAVIPIAGFKDRDLKGQNNTIRIAV